jgi:hypothetical protein
VSREAPPSGGAWDFDVTYAPESDHDGRWAAWVTWQLREAQFRAGFAPWDLLAGDNEVLLRKRALSTATLVVMIRSTAAIASEHLLAELSPLLTRPADLASRLLCVQIDALDLADDTGGAAGRGSPLVPLVPVDLTGADDEAAAAVRLLDGVRHTLAGRVRPASPPWAGFLRPSFPPARARISNLPPVSKVFVVRDPQLADVRAALWSDSPDDGTVRVHTVTGPGGSGRAGWRSPTRLSTGRTTT